MGYRDGVEVSDMILAEAFTYKASSGATRRAEKLTGPK